MTVETATLPFAFEHTPVCSARHLTVNKSYRHRKILLDLIKGMARNVERRTVKHF